MRRQTKFEPMDGLVLFSVVLLVIIGLWIVLDASYIKALEDTANRDAWYSFKRQVVAAIAGIAVMLVIARVNFKTLIKVTIPLLVISILLLIAVMIPGIGHRVNGAYRWISLGPINIQPSEIAKLALVLYLARLLSQRKKMVRHLFSEQWVAPVLVIAIITGLVFKEPDMGTALAIVATVFAMLFTAGAKKFHLALGVGVGAALSYAAVKLEPYRMERIKVWLDPWHHRYGDGYQIVHSLIGLGTGGVFGVGFCEGREKMYIPAASTDFIFATVGEEIGLIGSIFLLALFVFFIARGLDLARRTKSTYANLLAVGVTSMIGMQALINVAVVSASIPATGVPLPFISYGGSSLFLTLASVGVLLAVSRQANIDMEPGKKK